MLVDGDEVGHDTLCVRDSDAKEVVRIQHFRNACFPGGGGGWEGGGHTRTGCARQQWKEVYTNLIIHCDIV